MNDIADASPELQAVLRSKFGHDAFRGDQSRIMIRLLRGQHCLVIMPTGMGKSLCYQIPAVVLAQRYRQSVPKPNGESAPLTLVLSPLIALMKDQVDALVGQGVSAALINSSLTRPEREQRYAEVAAGKYDLLYVSPERFRKPEFLDVLDQRQVSLLAVDEAHCISEWGHDFRPDYTRIGEIRQQLGDPTTIALTATATREVQADILRNLNLSPDQMQTYHAGIERPNLQLLVSEVWDDDAKLDQILETRRQYEGSGIVYFNLIRSLLEFSDQLRSHQIPHLVYHGDLERQQRRRLQDTFMQQPNHLVLATNAFGMGIDKEDIRFVMHADLPGSLEAYYQEIGRAGRDGKPAVCRLLYDQRDLATQMEFVKWSNPDIGFYQRVHDFLTNDQEQVNAYGIEWLRKQLHGKQTHDHRLDTALSMLFRWGVLEGRATPNTDLRVVSALPPELTDGTAIADKLQRDQTKLLNLVQYVKHEGDRVQFLHDYFGVLKAESP